MEITTELNDKILEFIKSLGVICGLSENIITLNRTSMMCCSICQGLNEEEDSYHMILEMIKEKFSDKKYWITYAGKTDDDYFLPIYIRSHETNKN